MKVMFLGTSSGAGKSVLTSIVCRHLHRDGVKVTPYKSLNMSRRSYVLPDGREMGVAQALQAWASGIDPDPRMNSILLKPQGAGKVLTLVGGTPWASDSPDRREEMFQMAMGHYHSLREGSEAMVLEGSGSPVELNLMAQDIGNLRTARATGSPVILVGDISRGGVFAGLLGTHALMPKEDQARVKGFIINRFLGDASLLESGIRRLEKETGLPHLGTMPLLDLNLPEEDAGGTGDHLSNEAREPWLRDIDLLTDVAAENLDMDAIMRIMKGC